jgi:hypothetical protein
MSDIQDDFSNLVRQQQYRGTPFIETTICALPPHTGGTCPTALFSGYHRSAPGRHVLNLKYDDLLVDKERTGYADAH